MPGENRAALAPSASSIKMADLEPIPDRKDPCNPCDNPIGTRLSPMCPVRSVTYVSGPDMSFPVRLGGTRTIDLLINRAKWLLGIVVLTWAFAPPTLGKHQGFKSVG